MPVFLVLSSLSIVFYLVLLVALHRDNRRRRISPHSFRKVRLGVVAEIGSSSVPAQPTLATRRHVMPYGAGRPVIEFSAPSSGSTATLRDSPKRFSVRVRTSGDDYPSRQFDQGD